MEEEGAERASYALKLLQSEGELTIASTGKDPQSGRHVTQEYHVEGPVMIMLTTTAIDIDEELLNRCLVLTVDERKEQTERIHVVQRAYRTLDGQLEELHRRSVLEKLHRNAQRLLRRVAVVNPHAKSLTFPSHRTRLRRDHAKYLSLIEVIAFVHQHQRARKSVDVGGGKQIEYIEVERSDIALANKLFAEVLQRSLDELSPQTRAVLSTIEVTVGALAAAQGVEVGDIHFTRRDVREWTWSSNTRVHVHLKRLEDFDYVVPYRCGIGHAMTYTLLVDPLGRQDGNLSGHGVNLSGGLPGAFRSEGGKVFPNDNDN